MGGAPRSERIPDSPSASRPQRAEAPAPAPQETDFPPAPLPAPVPVVGIGASAGGLQALEALFTNLPADTGAAFVVVQHLSPDFKSLMDELLAKHTRMAIRVVDENQDLEPDHIYLIPPRSDLRIEGDAIVVSRQDRTSSPGRSTTTTPPVGPPNWIRSD